MGPDDGAGDGETEADAAGVYAARRLKPDERFDDVLASKPKIGGNIFNQVAQVNCSGLLSRGLGVREGQGRLADRRQLVDGSDHDVASDFVLDELRLQPQGCQRSAQIVADAGEE